LLSRKRRRDGGSGLRLPVTAIAVDNADYNMASGRPPPDCSAIRVLRGEDAEWWTRKLENGQAATRASRREAPPPPPSLCQCRGSGAVVSIVGKTKSISTRKPHQMKCIALWGARAEVGSGAKALYSKRRRYRILDVLGSVLRVHLSGTVP